MDVKDLALYDEQMRDHIRVRLHNLHKLIGSRVRILKGKYKGRVGILREVSFHSDAFVYRASPISLKDGKLLTYEDVYGIHSYFDWNVSDSAPLKIF